MTDGKSRDESPTDEPLTPDMIEQHQRPDGTVEELDTVEADSDVPLSPDMIEQRQRPDGALDTSRRDEAGEGPLTPDMIEQRHIVEDDDSEDWRAE